MAGMYPDNQSIEIFGEQVQWPGVDASGKFSNGSFSDPSQKPSYIPAGTLNLILDNLAALITEMGGNPNNTDTNQLANLFTAAKLIDKLTPGDEGVSGVDAAKLNGKPGSYYALKDSPVLTGTPKAPTAAVETNNTQIATTAFVQGAITAALDVSMGDETLYAMVTENGMTLIPAGTYRVVIVGAGGSAGTAAGCGDGGGSIFSGRGGAGTSGEMVETCITLYKDTRFDIVCGEGGIGEVSPTGGNANGYPGRRGGNTEVQFSGGYIIAYGGSGGAAGARMQLQGESAPNAPDGESSEVAVGGAGFKDYNTTPAPNLSGTKKYSWIAVGSGLMDGSNDSKFQSGVGNFYIMTGHTGGGINEKEGGNGGSLWLDDDKRHGGDGELGCGGGSSVAPMWHSKSFGIGLKAGNGGNGYVEFWKMAG